MIKSCIDYNLVISDNLIIRCFEEFENKFANDFYSKITKENYKNDTEVPNIVDDIVNNLNGKIFLDIKDNKLKSFSIKNELLIIS